MSLAEGGGGSCPSGGDKGLSGFSGVILPVGGPCPEGLFLITVPGSHSLTLTYERKEERKSYLQEPGFLFGSLSCLLTSQYPWQFVFNP